MTLSPEAEALRDKFFRFLVNATRPLWHGPDPEVALEALVEAADQLGESLRGELTALRQDVD